MGPEPCEFNPSTVGIWSAPKKPITMVKHIHLGHWNCTSKCTSLWIENSTLDEIKCGFNPFFLNPMVLWSVIYRIYWKTSLQLWPFISYTGYKWDYISYKWGYKYLSLVFRVITVEKMAWFVRSPTDHDLGWAWRPMAPEFFCLTA